MKHRASILFFLALSLLPRLATAWELELTLSPGDPPHPITLPRGVSAEDVSVSVVDLDVEPERIRERVFIFAGRSFEVSPSSAELPFRIRTVPFRGRVVLLVGAERHVPAGRVHQVTLQISIDREPSSPLPPVPLGWDDALPEPEPVLAIVTNRIVRARSLALERYVSWRQSQGMTVILGTEDDWDVPSELPPDGRAERIRSWLRDLHDEVGIGYVLLIGDPTPSADGVPMKLTHPLKALIRTYPDYLRDHIDPVPTDHYYADLHGNWDLDGDGEFGSFPEDRGSGGINWVPDVIVGRIPVYWNAVERLDEILEMTMDYETSSDTAYRHRLLLPAAFIGFEGGPTPSGRTYSRTIDGAAAAEQIVEAASRLDDELELLRFYEEDGVVPSAFPHELPLDNGTLLREIRQGAGLAVAIGHGSPEGIYRTVWLGDYNDDGIPDDSELFGEPFLSAWNFPGISDAPPSFLFLATCENGWPEFPENMGFAPLAHGSAATISSSRVAVGGGGDFEPDPEYGDADTLAYTFVHLLLEGMSVGGASAYLRYGLPADGWGYQGGYPMGGYGWLGKFEFNLFGDPLLRLGRCDDDEACMPNSACQGSSRCVEGFCVVETPPTDCSHLDEGCLVGRCDPESGDCGAINAPEGRGCDDDLFCTDNDTCLEGECVGGEPTDCEPPEGFISVCVELEGGCVYEPDPDAGPVGDPVDGSHDDLDSTRGCNGCQVGAPASTWGVRAVRKLLPI